MKFAKPILNADNARAEYIKSDNGDSFHNSLLGFSHYSPSYVLTNEDIRWVSGLTQNKGPRVLTVAASGDHPMFYAMRGATNIDTFDISFCAKVAMDIKTAAIQKLSRDEYVQLLNDMHQAQRIAGQVLQVDGQRLRAVVDQLPGQQLVVLLFKGLVEQGQGLLGAL